MKFDTSATYESTGAFMPHLIELNSTRQKCDVWTGPNLNLVVTSIPKWFTLGKMGHTWKKWSDLKNWSHIRKSGSHLEKSVKLGKIGHTWKNGWPFEKWATLGKMGHTFWKMGHTWKNGSHLEETGWHFENGSHFENWVTLGKMRHTWNKESHLGKGVFLEDKYLC